MRSIDGRIARLEDSLQPTEPVFEIVSFPTDEAYQAARARGELPRFARVYIGVDLERV